MKEEAPQKLLVIGNPAAGAGRGAARLEEVAAALRAAGRAFRAERTPCPESVFDAAASCTVLAVGGDGTLHAVVQGLAEAARRRGEDDARLGPLVLLPAGSGNDFAAMTGCASTVEEALAACASAEAGGAYGVLDRAVDLGRITITETGPDGAPRETPHWFANSFGTAFEAFVNREVASVARPGLTKYLIGVLRALRHLPRVHFELTLENGTAGGEATVRRTCELAMLTANNTARSGGGFRLAPEARWNDGALDALLVQAVSRPRVLTLLPGALTGALSRHPLAELHRFTRLVARMDTPMPVALDGELVSDAASALQITVEPGRLALRVPSDQARKRSSTR